MICRLRRQHPRWGARRIAHELGGRGLESAPSRATVHRVLSRKRPGAFPGTAASTQVPPLAA
ncbi:hypothetical protein OG430_42280 [Streptomyces sp. NBC_01304]|nr:hypothetical protein OG430_42280 [Streptomyces sp. NBC_01304]